MAVIANIVGLDEVIRKLNSLPTKLAKNAMRRSLRKGANAIRDVARANAKRIDDPDTRAEIYKNIAVYGGGRRRERAAGGPMMRVGVRGGARFVKGKADGLPGGDTTHWRFVEFGTSKMQAEPFMRPAMEQGASAAFSAILADMPKQIDKELAKL
jgi:HK97 gp10 family phage protein